MMRFKAIPLLAVFLSATALWAETVTQARVTNRNERGYGELRITADGKERVFVPKGVGKAWVIEDGGAVVYTKDGGRIADYHTDLLLRYDAATGTDTALMGRFSELESLRVTHSQSGQAVLIVSGSDDATGSPTTYVVHPRRGVVWRGTASRVAGLRNGRVAIAQYQAEAGGEAKDKPLRTIYLDLDPLLKRPILQSQYDKMAP